MPIIHQFENHRGITPMLSVFATLVVIELLVVHLLVSLKWPSAAWVLTLLSLVSIGWLVRWIRSFKKCPHVMRGGVLTCHMGSLASRSVPLANIKAVDASWQQGGHRGQDILNLVPLAYPNRIIELFEPISGRRGPVTRIAVRFDNPAEFDAAMDAVGAEPLSR